MARNVTDCALFLDSMSGFDSSSPVSYPAPEIPYQEAVKRADANVRIAYSPDLNGFASVSKEWNQVLRDALQAVENSGGTVEEDCPILPNLNRCYRILRAMVWAALRVRLTFFLPAKGYCDLMLNGMCLKPTIAPVSRLLSHCDTTPFS